MLGGALPGNNDVCDTGLAYACGDTGESGVGIVFYASATPFACGPDLASTCNFLEVAPNLWNPNSASKCPGKDCGGTSQQTSDVTGTGKGITMCTGPLASNPSAWPTDEAVGAGYANTTVWITGCNSYDAPNAARAYQGGGMTDWSLPSFSELDALYNYPNRNDIGGFVASAYWSSTGYGDSGGVVDVDVVAFNGGWRCADLIPEIHPNRHRRSLTRCNRTFGLLAACRVANGRKSVRYRCTHGPAPCTMHG